MTAEVERAAAARDAAMSRIRRTTTVAGIAGAALVATFTGLAAASTHARKVLRARPRPAAQPKTAGPVRAPAPPLVPVPGAGTSSPAEQAPQAPPAAPQPAPQEAPPVAVTGGS